jgi:hypothetical protein
MVRKWMLALAPLSIVLVAASDQTSKQTWKDKQIPEWTESEAKQVLTDSPWAKSVKPSVDHARDGQRRDRGGIGLPGIGLGIPGIGMGRYPGGGYPGGGYPGGGYPGGGYPGGGYPGGGYPGGGYPGGAPGGGSQTGGNNGNHNQPAPELKLRWESALPIREAELKAHDLNAPTVDQNHYAIAVYGVPNRMVNGGSRNLANQLKKQAALKRDGKKSIKPSSVEVLQREDGPVFVYLFPRSNEITAQDKQVEFDARIGRLQFSQPFFLDEMVWANKLEL